MDHDALRERNNEKATAEQERGPARSEPVAVPIGEAIEAFHARGDLSFAIPAHGAGTGGVVPEGARWAGIEAFRADPGMNSGVDNRHQSWQVQPTAMELFAQAVGADETLFSTNGSSLNVRVAIMAAVPPGGTIAMARNGHKSAFAGLVLAGVWPVYLEPEYDERWEIAHGVAPAVLARELRDHPEAAAAMIFSPSYYGISSDIKGLAEVAHAHDLPLLSDDAWGLYYGFSSRLAPTALESGADLTIGSVHKTLSGLSQTSVLSIQGERIDRTRLNLVFELEQSTSASALLLSSIDAARRQFQRDGEQLIGRSIDLALRLRAAIDELPGLTLMGDDVVSGPGAIALDPQHVTFDVVDLGVTGYSAADWLQQHHGIHVELADHRRLMPIISFSDTDENIDRLIAALRDLVEHHEDADPAPSFDLPHPSALRMETVMLPRDAFLGMTEMVTWREAAGRVSAEMICPYPPGIPVTAPGELLTQEVVDYLQDVVAAGGIVEGAADQSLAELRVVARA